MGTELGKVQEIFETRHEKKQTTETATEMAGLNATKAFSATRILFGAIFLFDGILKWILFQQGTMQASVQAVNVFNYAAINNNWFAFGLLVALGETLGGIALMIGFFQRPAAIWSAAIMFAIWAFGGYGGLYMAGTWSFTGYTDPGGDLMLALVFVVLIFAPYAYGLAPRFKLRERFSGNTFGKKVLRFLVS